MAQEKTVAVDLRRTYRQGTKSYGPGQGVEVPESLAASLGLQASTAKKSAAKSSSDDLPTVAELPAALKGKSKAEIRAMQKNDDRVSAEAVYAKALEDAK